MEYIPSKCSNELRSCLSGGERILDKLLGCFWSIEKSYVKLATLLKTLDSFSAIKQKKYLYY